MKPEFVLCIDVGNTRLKWGVCQLSALAFSETGVINNDPEFLAEELFKGLESYEPMPVWVSMVASSKVRRTLDDGFRQSWQRKVEYIETLGDSYKDLNSYKEKSSFGIDRWLALVAAQRRYQNHYCVIDAGTAVTVDVVDDGKHCGGVIMPGKKLLMSALNNGAAGITVSSGKVAELAHNTSDAVVSGVMLSLIGGVERAIDTIRGEYEQIVFVLTGGDAELIKDSLDIGFDIQTNLVLEGVGLIARNKYA